MMILEFNNCYITQSPGNGNDKYCIDYNRLLKSDDVKHIFTNNSIRICGDFDKTTIIMNEISTLKFSDDESELCISHDDVFGDYEVFKALIPMLAKTLLVSYDKWFYNSSVVFRFENADVEISLTDPIKFTGEPTENMKIFFTMLSEKLQKINILI